MSYQYKEKIVLNNNYIFNKFRIYISYALNFSPLVYKCDSLPIIGFR